MRATITATLAAFSSLTLAGCAAPYEVKGELRHAIGCPTRNAIEQIVVATKRVDMEYIEALMNEGCEEMRKVRYSLLESSRLSQFAKVRVYSEGKPSHEMWVQVGALIPKRT